jgi:hypothetical protein
MINCYQTSAADEEQPTFGLLDLVVLVALAAGGLYYFFRKKPEER